MRRVFVLIPEILALMSRTLILMTKQLSDMESFYPLRQPFLILTGVSDLRVSPNFGESGRRKPKKLLIEAPTVSRRFLGSIKLPSFLCDA